MALLPVSFPDAELVAIEYLRPRLPTGWTVHRRTPNPRPARFVTVLRQGGVADQLVDRPRLAVFAWGSSDTEAKDMAAELRAAMAEIPSTAGGARILRRNEFSGLSPAPDPSGQARWTFTHELWIRGTAR